ALRASPVKLRTMGRDLDEDPLAFLCAGAAGRYAARLLREAEERAESTQVEGPLPSSRGGKSGGS
ncbi:MAG: hypothetical protein Q4P36_02315, partial [Bowdeniella nasicola]|nr:hypothetical protein [Bowdeniella nasicola]